MTQKTKVTNEAVARERANQEARERQPIKLYCPIRGEISSIAQAPDQTFADKLLGDGVVIDPHGHTIYSPCDGEVSFVFPTNHAIVVKEDSGLEILIHIGKGAIHLEKNIFTLCVSEGQQVKKGDKLLEFDLNYLKKYGKSPAIPMVVKNLQGKQLKIVKTGLSNEKEMIIQIYEK